MNEESAGWNTKYITDCFGKSLKISDMSINQVNNHIKMCNIKTKVILKQLEGVSHLGNYQKWITDNKSFLADLKWNNPMSYDSFMKEFASIKSQLKNKGVLQ